MDAVEYLKARPRFAKMKGIYYPNTTFAFNEHDEPLPFNLLEEERPEDAVKLMELFVKNHPIKTRQSEFLKIFPNAEMRDDCYVVNIKPCVIDYNYRPEGGCVIQCRDCTKEYWLTEIEEEE